MKNLTSFLKLLAVLPLGIIGLIVPGVARGATIYTNTFNTSGTWTVPAGVTSVQVLCWGGGGGSGGATNNTTGNTTNRWHGAGGAGGAFAGAVVSVNPGDSYSCVVGAGGVGGPAGVLGGKGGSGGSSWFSNVTTTVVSVLAQGGGGGTNGSYPAAGGGKAAANLSIGTTIYIGGNGASAVNGGPPGGGGGGGGSAGSEGNGISGVSTNGGVGGIPDGGTGANARPVSGGAGVNATTLGGGAGGATAGTAIVGQIGGIGGTGRLTLIYTVPFINLTWIGDGVNNLWSTNSTDVDWDSDANGTPDSGFNNLDVVTFDSNGSANPTVNIATPVLPTAVTVNTSSSYLFTGGGKISGITSLVQSGAGTLTVDTTNDYSGGTVLNAGTLAPGNDNALGTGAINLYGGILTSASGARTVTNAVVLQAITQLGLGNGDFTFTGPITSSTATSNWHLTNGGTATIQGTLYQSGGGGFDIHASRLVIDGGMATNANNGIRLYTLGAEAEMDITNNGVYAVGTVSGSANVRLGQTANDPGTAIFNISSGSLQMWPYAQGLVVGAAASTTGMVYQTGGTVQWFGQNASGGVFIGASSGAYGEYHLDGGSLVTPQITGTNTATGYFYANGGTITVQANSFLDSFISVVPVVLQSGGAVIDNGGYAATVSSPVSGNGPLTLIDTGTLTLAGGYTNAGLTTVSNGTLNVVLPASSGAVTLAPGAGLTTSVSGMSAATWTSSSLTLQGANTLTFANVPGAQVPATLLATTTLNASGTHTVNVTGNGWPVGTTTLLQYGGSVVGGGTFTFGPLPAGVVGYLTNNPADSAIELVASFSANALTWYGNNGSGSFGGLWDIATTANWNGGAAQYEDNGTIGDMAIFDGSISPNPDVQLAAAVHPFSVLVSNATSGFVFYGPGKISGVGSLTKQLGGDLTLNLTNDYSGGTFLQQGSITLNTKDALPVAGILTLGSTGKSASLILNGFDQTLGGLLPGGGGSIVNNSATPVTLTFNVATGTATFYNNALGQSGNANANNFSVVKNGGGEQRLGVAYYSGTTVVNAGTLGFTALLDANLTNTITVNAGGTLDGVGVLGGPVTLNNGATLSPGNDGVGTLTITNNSLAMVSGATNWFEINNTNGQSDLVNLVGSANVSVTYGGALVVTNVGAVALTNGQTFQLFNVASGGVINDNFSTVTILPATGATGDFNPANGVLTINVSTIPTTPTNMTYSVGGGKISLSWPASYLGWSLQAQTNALNKGLGANWVTVPGSSLVTSTNFPLVPGNPAVFYRIFYQP